MFFDNWLNFYNSIKHDSWPECVTEHEFKFLPDEIKNEVINIYNGSHYLALNDNDIKIFAGGKDYPEKSQWTDSDDGIKKFAVAKDFNVFYTADIDGYGMLHSQVYPLMIAKLYPEQQFDTCLEWCAGPGFIGFRLIADNIVNALTLMDCYKPALDACNNTWQHRPNRLMHKSIETIQGSTVDCLEDRLFDLIVANPPNFDTMKELSNKESKMFRITQDPGWQTHNDFFLKIKKNLAPNGKILLMKNKNGSQPSDHIKSITDGGLKLERILTIVRHPHFYFMEVTHM